MKKIQPAVAALFLTLAASSFAGTTITTSEKKAVAPQEEEKVSRDLFSLETTYTGSSHFTDSRFGSGDSLHDDFSYDHRFHVSGNWYFRLGVEYERFDFGGSDNGLPDHLQATYAHIAYEYVVHDHAGAGIELDPGFYFQNNIRGDAFDIPWKIWVSFPLIKDKVFGVIGVGGGINQRPQIAPGGGIIWLISDKLRLEGVVPKPALVYNASDNWEFRLLGELVYESFRTDDVLTPDPKFKLHNAVVQYSEYLAGLQATYSGFKPFDIKAGAGYDFERRFDFFRAHRRERTDGAFYVRLGVEAKF
jgi:hypothetical protein